MNAQESKLVANLIGIQMNMDLLFVMSTDKYRVKWNIKRNKVFHTLDIHDMGKNIKIINKSTFLLKKHLKKCV